MILSNRLSFYGTLASLTIGFWSFATNATALVIYQDNFDGSSGTTFLNGAAPDVDNNGGSNTWLAYGSATNSNGYKEDGTLASANVSQGAWLPFTPLTGNVYTLSVSLTGVGPQSANTAWYAFGFAKSLPADPQSGQNRFLEGNTIGRAWMLFRATTPQGSNFNQSQRGDATTGTGPTGTAQPWVAGAPANGGDVDMQIVLNTTAATWTADYFAKRPTDGSYLEVSPGALPLLAQDISSVGFARTTNSTGSLTGKITNFSLQSAASNLIPGDVNGDMVVDVNDFNIIRDHLFQSGTRAQGDLTGNGFVDFSDFRQWKTAFEGAGAGAGSSFDIAIPEPASASIAILAIVGGCAGGRRRRNVSSPRNS